MLNLLSLGSEITDRRKALGLTQLGLAQKAGISRATLDALENGRAGEMGFSKISNILSSLGLELHVQDARPGRPTLDELLEEDENDQSLDGRR